MRRWLQQATGGLPRQFWFLWTGTLINRLGSFVIIYLAIYLTQQLDFSQSQAGLVLGAYGVGGAVGTMTGGVLADRWGRRPTLLTAQFGAAALMLGLGFAQGFWQLVAGALLLGLFAEGVRPAFQAMMIDIVPDRDRLRAYSLNYWAINLGFASAAVLAGFAAQFDYLLLFVVDAGTTLITALISLIFLAETRPSGTRGVPRTKGAPGLGTVFRDRVFLIFLGLNFFVVLIIMQHMSTLPIAMSADGLGPATFGWVIAVNGIMIVAGQLFVPKLIGGHDRSRVLALATLIIGVGFGLNAFAGAAALYVLSVVIWTLGEMLQTPSNSALVAELSPAALRGRYQGVNSLSWSAGSALAPIVGGFVQQHLGSTALWLGCAAIGVVVAAGQIFSGPSRERRVTALRAALPATDRLAEPEIAAAGPEAEPVAAPGTRPATTAEEPAVSPAATEQAHPEDVTPPEITLKVPARD
ncbi:MDR family MFS transporter [Actinoplanes friuliensis]|uniref:Major facilitator superfamily protein n=1 Tax=Actinoplanes friuliensis DSM 7358 TaxID=1246995 RepID=U5WBE8_9ACTN|nr:MFS transporter [Actinoplanes friuliensis]AGZ46312.1 major facilitator superfamily protein [Actinoplanes friuliensis DSM 7358]